MRRIILIICFAFQVVFLTQTYCQSLTGPQRRIVNESLLELINYYENYSRFTTDNNSISENYIKSFNSLFTSDASLYLDITPSNKVSDPVNLSEYVAIFRKYYSNGIGIKLHNILFDLPEYLNNNSYKIKIELSKEFYGYSKTNINYRDTIPLVFTVLFNMTGNQVGDKKILSITGDPRGRFIKVRVLKFLTLKPVINARVKLDSELKKTNGQGVTNFGNIDPLKKHSLIISYEHYKPIIYSNLDIDRFIEGNTDRYQKRLRYDYYDPNEFILVMNTFNFSISAVASFNFPGFKTIVSKDQKPDLKLDNLRERGGISPRFGIRFGFLPVRTKDFDFSINAGIEKTYLMGTYLFDLYNKESSVVDPENEPYNRIIDLYNQKQKITLNFTDFPLLISVNYKHFKDFDIGANFGVRFSTLKKSSCSIKSGFSISGSYPQFDTIYTSNYYDFKDTRISEKSTFPSVRKYFSYQIGLTVSKEIYPSLRVYVGPTLFLYTKELMKNAVLSDILSKDEEVNNILYTYKISRMKSVSLEFGLIYYFNSINLKKQL
jgi:hypothetical protein